MAGKKKSGYDGKIAGLYDLEETIGHGHFAVVKLARHVFTGEKVAVKVIDKQKLDDISRSHLFQEVRCMKLVQHPNVVRLYEVIDTQTKLYLILELGDGDMYDYIMKHATGLDESLAKKYFRQIVEAILYCHRLHVVHRDLKPENVVFFNKLGIVKLTDFGFSNVFAPGKKLDTSCGSLAYSAPEILLGDSYDPPAVDVWSLGVILFMLVAGRAPFQEANDSETLTMIMDCKYQIPAHVSDACCQLINKMLVREPADRISLEDIEKDLWLAGDANDDAMMQINLPLLSREHVSEEDHSYVVQKMVEGKICTREEIFQSLERDAYDHIAATYYLLVERRLRKIQQHEASASQTNIRKQSAPSNAITGGKPHLEPLMLSPRKSHDSKKIKTELVNTATVIDPSFIVSPPLMRGAGTQTIGLPESPGGPEFVKTLTTSMTLDRRISHHKKQSERSIGLSGALSAGVGANHSPPVTFREERNVKKSHQKAKSAPLMSSPGESFKVTEKKKKQPGPAISKIAILSSFFERKAAQESGHLQQTPPRQRLFPWIGKKDRKSKRVVNSPNSPTSFDYSEYDYHPQRIQSTSSEHSDSSSLVQSLVSPPGTHLSPSSASPKMTFLSPEAVYAAMRKCSLIREESQGDDDDDDDDLELDSSELKPSRSLEFLDERTSDLSATAGKELGLSSKPAGGSSDPVKPPRPLKTVCSSPQLLNQIHEENESEDDDDFVPLKLTAPQGRYAAHSAVVSPEILSKYDQRRRRKGTGQKGTSCSSSDASDTDDSEGRSRQDKLKHNFMLRRDSSDHSSDTEGPGEGHNMGGGNCVGGGGKESTSSHKSSGKEGGAGGAGAGGGNKSGKTHSYRDGSTSGSEDPCDTSVSQPCVSVASEYSDIEILKYFNSYTISNLNDGQGNQLTRSSPAIVENETGSVVEVLKEVCDIIASPKKQSVTNESPASSKIGVAETHNGGSAFNNNTITNLRYCSSDTMSSSSPSKCTAQYNGQVSSHGSENISAVHSAEFSEITEHFDCLDDNQSRSSTCLADCGLSVSSNQSPGRANVKQNGLTSAFCKVGTGSPVVQMESKCCSVV